MSDGTLDWIRWPLMAKAIAVGIGLGSIYGVATGEFVLGLMIGAATGVGFSVGRSYATR